MVNQWPSQLCTTSIKQGDKREGIGVDDWDLTMHIRSLFVTIYHLQSFVKDW